MGSSSWQVASSSQRIEEETATECIIPWPGEPGSLGYHGADSCDPPTRFSIELSKSLAARLRHGHRPWVEITPDGWTRLLDLLAPSEGAASAGRRCPGSGAPKGRYELGLCAGVRYIRALQGHSRTNVDAETMLQELSAESLPERLLHGTHWSLFESIRERIPQCRLTEGKAKDAKDASTSTSSLNQIAISRAHQASDRTRPC